jgi:hypothetical protein
MADDHNLTQAADDNLADVQRRQAHADYVQDQLQQTRTTADHARVLRARAPARIAAAKAALAARAPLPPGATAQDDSLSQYHVVERMLDERAFYPPHDKRTESPAYAQVHHRMTVVDDKPCLVCGVRHSTLGDAASNPFGAVQMETHHHTIEWALANAIDADKFNQHVRPGLLHAAQRRAQAPEYASVDALYKAFDQSYQTPMDLDTIKAWIDHGADNLWVLCDIHHRHKFVGIHAITYPIWGPQDVVDAQIVSDEIGVSQSTKQDV